MSFNVNSNNSEYLRSETDVLCNTKLNHYVGNKSMLKGITTIEDMIQE